LNSPSNLSRVLKVDVTCLQTPGTTNMASAEDQKELEERARVMMV
jgi:hypothetical protein